MAATTDQIGRDLDDELHFISWNMNGLRTFNMSEVLTKRVGTMNCSILAIQETKLTRKPYFSSTFYQFQLEIYFYVGRKYARSITSLC